MWPDTTGCPLRQKTSRQNPCGVCLHHAPIAPFLFPHPLFSPSSLRLILSHPSSSSPPSLSPGTQAQQAFRSEPRNLTVRMGATAVLRCEVLRASGTVQWVKDGLLLGPQRSLPGFPRYSMIGNPKRGKQ